MTFPSCRLPGLTLALLGVCTWIGVASAGPLEEQTFSVLSYNVAALPPFVQLLKDEDELDPLIHIPIIADRLEAGEYDLVAIQEGFVHGIDEGPPYIDHEALGVGSYFYDLLTENQSDPPFLQVTPADEPGEESQVSSGLARLSNFLFTGYVRDKWDVLAGSDELSDKGWSFARHVLEEDVSLDVYNWHANAGSKIGTEEERAQVDARAAHIEELIVAINTHSAGRAVLVLGDSNTLYPRLIDTNRRLLGLEEGPEGSQDLDPPLSDVWIEIARKDEDPQVPEQDGEKLEFCGDLAGPECEQKDKILYRSSELLTLIPTDYFVESDFVDPATGFDLSDHYATGAVFSYTVTLPEPAGGAFVALVCLAVLARRASSGR